MNGRSRIAAVLCAAIAGMAWQGAEAGTLKTHGVFSSNMVIQRGKPIKVWGWAGRGAKVRVQFGDARADAGADAATGRWEATFPAREADATGRKKGLRSGNAENDPCGVVRGKTRSQEKNR